MNLTHVSYVIKYMFEVEYSVLKHLRFAVSCEEDKRLSSVRRINATYLKFIIY